MTEIKIKNAASSEGSAYFQKNRGSIKSSNIVDQGDTEYAAVCPVVVAGA